MFEPRASRQPQAGQSLPRGRLPVSNGTNEDVHLLDRLTSIYRHRRLVISVFTIVVTLMMLQSYSTIPLYRATARVLIEEEATINVAGMDSGDPYYWSDPEPYYETQYRILQSPGLVRYTLEKVDLSQVPEFTGEAPTQFGPLEAIRAARTTVTGWAQAVGTSILGIVRPEALDTEPPVSPEDRALLASVSGEQNAQIGEFVSRITVSPVGNTRLVDVMFTAKDPRFAAEAANAHVETYVERNLARRLDSVRQQLDWVTSELTKQQQAVQDSNRALSAYREDQDALSLNASTDVVTTRLASLSTDVNRAEAARLQAESLYDQVRDLDPESDAALDHPAIATRAAVASATATLSRLEAERGTLSGRYGARHPEMLRINSEIQTAAQAVQLEVRRAIQAIRSDYQLAVAEEEQLRREFDQQKLRAEDLSRKQGDYGVLERQALSSQRIYDTLLEQQKELEVVANSRANNVQIQDRAQVPATPFTPNTRRDWLTAVAVGLMFAVGLVVVVEYLDDTIKTPDDVSRRLHLPLLGLVPAVRGDRPPVLSADVPHDFGEAYRSLRTALVFSSGSTSSRIIGVTSTQPLEGKTTTASNLALVLALGGARVLLIDADMRRPSVHKTLGMANGVGLSHVLVGQARIRESIQRTHDPNLFALTAGQPPPNPSELLASDRMRSLLASLESGPFDWIIVDAPPVLAVTDAVVLAPLVSGMVFVLGAEMTRSTHAERAVEMLQAGGTATVLGVVLNRVDFGRNKYYYSRYYGYHYKSYYSDSSAAA